MLFRTAWETLLLRTRSLKYALFSRLIVSSEPSGKSVGLDGLFDILCAKASAVVGLNIVRTNSVKLCGFGWGVVL